MENEQTWSTSTARAELLGTPWRRVLWDFDGVVVDSEPIHAGTYAELLGGWGNDVRDDFFSSCQGHTEPEIWAMLARRFRVPVDADEGARLRAELVGRDFAAVSPTWLAADLVPELGRRGVPQTVVSAGVRELIVELLERWGWREALPVEPVPEGKRETLPRLWTAQPVLTLEDNAGYLEAARAAGSATLAVGHSMNGALPPATWSVHL